MCVLGLLKGPHENLASWNSRFLVAITMEKNRHTEGSFCSERNVELLSVSCQKISNLLILQTESRWLLCKLTHYGPADLIKMNVTAFINILISEVTFQDLFLTGKTGNHLETELESTEESNYHFFRSYLDLLFRFGQENRSILKF